MTTHNPSGQVVKLAVMAAATTVAAYFGYRAYYFYHLKRKQKESSVAESACEPQPPMPSLVSAETNNTEPTILDAADSIHSAAELRAKGNDAYKHGEYDRAIDCYTKAIKQYPLDHADTAFAYANRAACFLKLARFDAVLSDCSEALKIQPEFVKALDRRSQAFEQLDRLEDSLVDATAACIINDFKNESLVQRVESILRQLSTDSAQKDFENKILSLPSLALIEEFLATFPGEFDFVEDAGSRNANQFLHISISALRDKEYQKCFEFAKKAVNGPGSDADKCTGYNLLGTFDFLRGDIKSANDNLLKALAFNLSEKTPNILIKLALVELEQNNFTAMSSHLERSFALAPRNPALYYHRGEVLALSGSLDGAVKDFTCAIDLDPNFYLAYVHNARALLGMQRVDEAESFLSGALTSFPENVEILNSFGEVLVMKGDYAGADRVFSDILKKDPKAIQVYLNRALLAMNQNNAQEAEKHLCEAINIDSSFVAAHLQYANLLLSEGKTSECINHFDEALKHARNLQELISIHSLKYASIAQLRIIQEFPGLTSKMKYTYQCFI